MKARVFETIPPIRILGTSQLLGSIAINSKKGGKTMNIPAACIFDFDQDRLIGEKVYLTWLPWEDS